MMRNYRRRRRRPMTPPLILLTVALLLGAAWLVSDILHKEPAPQTEQSVSSGKDAASSGSEAPVVESEPEIEPEPVLTTADGVTCTLKQLGAEAIHTGQLILVNNHHYYQFREDQPLVSIYEEKSSSYVVARTDIYLDKVAVSALNTMMDDFREQGGSKTVNVVAGHRTAEFQQHLFDQSAERNGLEHAQKYVAQPGGSEHHTGLVVDFSILNYDGTSQDFLGTGEYAWITENCADYGFVVRYAEGKQVYTGIANEPWHFRYLGPVHAAKITEKNMCLEEYIDYLKRFTFEGERMIIECDAGTYEVWYAKGSEVYLPDSGAYTVSGNNVDGVIVTYKVD